ncbi:CPBP family intramembrane metalloprotease [Flavobacterium piscinae]|uniref:CPBP family intramembrane metalloprotease n=1 Tax=Flavobacterium piscinae TaxID=2506424 RepID=A0A4Q1KRK4_9FLAO|nr:type II CAAX endopeptidase family protein [Flavobacterium piscinae]MBC8882767.1 CPBP family intramembrane metalloprotease [Flavobacterium piscinae]RXR32265.1 CPBP family intramembrane metalloprotease [Flavobacterium piscinae]
MYIDQINNKKFNFILYLPIPLVFLGLIVMNYFATEDVNVEEMMQLMIDKLGTNLTFALMVGQLAVCCVILLFWVKFIHGQSIRSLTTSRKKVDWKRIFFSFTLWGTFTTITTLILFYLSPESFEINYDPIKFFPFLIIALLLIPLQTSFEEYFFRGYLLQGIGVVTKSRLIPLIITSITFGVMHIANPEVGKLGPIIMVYYIGTGFFLGIVTLMDEGLELALGFHAANNLIGALLVTADWTAFQTHSILKDVSEPSADYDVLFPVLVIFPILLFIFGKKYKWTNWKDKLTGKVHEYKPENEVINTIGNHD